MRLITLYALHHLFEELIEMSATIRVFKIIEFDRAPPLVEKKAEDVLSFGNREFFS